MTETPENYELFHYGVKGMKWGVRKRDKNSGGDSYSARYTAVRNRPLEEKKIVTKKGYEVHIKEDRTPVPAALLIAANTKLREKNLNFKSYTFKDSSGKNIGEAQFDRVNKDELNLVWLGVNPKARGKGVASSAFDLAVEKGREMGVKQITLEVPGNSPDAKHIYTKAGFKDRGLYKDSTVDDEWGGLTRMTMDIDQVRHADQSSDDDDVYEVMVRMFEHKLKVVRGAKHSDESSEDYELFHYDVKGMKWGVRETEEISEVSKLRSEPKDFSKNRKDIKMAESPENYELFHYGVKGMKWGVRKKRDAPRSFTKPALDFNAHKKLVKKEDAKIMRAEDRLVKAEKLASGSRAARKNKALQETVSAERRRFNDVETTSASKISKSEKAAISKNRQIMDDNYAANGGVKRNKGKMYMEATLKGGMNVGMAEAQKYGASSGKAKALAFFAGPYAGLAYREIKLNKEAFKANIGR